MRSSSRATLLDDATDDTNDYNAWLDMYKTLQAYKYYEPFSKSTNCFLNFNSTSEGTVEAVRRRPPGSLQSFAKDVRHTVLPTYSRPQRWSEIHCREIRVGWMLVKLQTCTPNPIKPLEPTDPGRYKVFVCGFENLYQYGRAIADGLVTLQQHKDLFLHALLPMKRMCREKVGRPVTLINHNLDVDVLHFKFVCEEDEKCGARRG